MAPGEVARGALSASAAPERARRAGPRGGSAAPVRREAALASRAVLRRPTSRSPRRAPPGNPRVTLALLDGGELRRPVHPLDVAGHLVEVLLGLVVVRTQLGVPPLGLGLAGDLLHAVPGAVLIVDQPLELLAHGDVLRT